MFELKKLNVHRIVATDEERDDLIEAGFELVGDIEPDYNAMTVKQLRTYADEKGVDLGDATKKEDIIAKLKGGQ